MSRSGRPSAVVRLFRQAGLLVTGAVVGAVTGLAGTAIHLEVRGSAVGAVPVGLVLALALIVAADLALALATRSAVALLGDATGRAVVLAVTIAPGPGGDVLLLGTWASEVWSLGAVLLPALAAPVVSMWSTASRVRALRRPDVARRVPDRATQA